MTVRAQIGPGTRRIAKTLCKRDLESHYPTAFVTKMILCSFVSNDYIYPDQYLVGKTDLRRPSKALELFVLHGYEYLTSPGEDETVDCTFRVS